MELVIMYLVAIAAVGIVGFMLVKKMDIKISLFLIGIVLMYIALLMGKDISFTDFVSSGVTWLDPFKVEAIVREHAHFCWLHHPHPWWLHRLHVPYRSQ